MEKKEVMQQVKLGAFVFAGVTLFLISVFFIGAENNIFSRTYDVSAVFKNVEGLKEGDNVWLSGVKIGTVTDVTIASQGKVVVKLSIKNNQHQFITEDATASVGSDGLVGNKIVVIRPGKSYRILNEDDTINTHSPADTQQLFNIAKDVGENTRSLTNDLKAITKKINDGQGIVGEFLNDGAIAQDIRLAVASLKTTSSNTAQLSHELHALITEMRTGDGLLPTLLSDTSYAKSFKNTMENVNRVSSSAGQAAQSLEHLTDKLNSKDNAVGVLLTDTTFAEHLRHTMSNTEQATEKLDANMQALQHNFLFRRYFKRHPQEQAEAASSKTSSDSN
jgi:phospholipid/cholesterol/gamma-HCH transport system substrate-binding protein